MLRAHPRPQSRDGPAPSFSSRSDPIEVTRSHRGPGSVFAVTRGIFRVDAIGPDAPVRIPPPRSVAFRLGRKDERPVPRWTAHVNCHDPIRVRPKLPPLFPFAVPTGNADALYLVVAAGQHFLDRAAACGAPDRVMLGRRGARQLAAPAFPDVLASRSILPSSETQGCALSQYTWREGLTQLGSSRVPAKTMTTPGMMSPSFVKQEPHPGQKR